MDDLTLYTNPMSRGRIVRWMLEEIGKPYIVEILDYGPPMKSAAYLAVNPMGKIPALRHNGVVVTEVSAICAYLADAFPEAGLAPPATERGAYYRWMFFSAGPLEAAVTNKAFGFEAPPGKTAALGYGSFAAVMDTMEYAISQSDYVAGNKFTAADVTFGSQIGFGLRFGTIEKRPAFETYFARLADRPAYTRASAIDDALMAPR